jgi:uncharacterized protein (DUF2147 family)
MKMLLSAAIAATALMAWAGPAAAGEPYGVWLRASTGTHLEFYDCAGKLCAKVAKVADPAKQSAVGTIVMDGAEKTKDNEWKGALTSEGSTYKGIVTLIDDNSLKLEGCALAGLICKGDTLTRVIGN